MDFHISYGIFFEDQSQHCWMYLRDIGVVLGGLLSSAEFVTCDDWYVVWSQDNIIVDMR